MLKLNGVLIMESSRCRAVWEKGKDEQPEGVENDKIIETHPLGRGRTTF